MIGCNILNLVALTFTVESAHDTIQNLLRKSEERLLRTREKSERQKLKYETRKLSKLELMNGGGFFEISKSTLTSMLSIRYTNRYQLWSLLHYFSLTYIIILVQFLQSTLGPSEWEDGGQKCNSTNTRMVFFIVPPLYFQYVRWKTIKQICTLHVCSVCLSFGSLNYCFYPPYWFECLVLYFTSSSRHENLATIEVQKFEDFSFPEVSYPDLFLTNNIWWKWRKNSLQMDLPENSPPCCHLLCKLCSLLFCFKFCG